jgi:GTP cyclohydrolase I
MVTMENDPTFNSEALMMGVLHAIGEDPKRDGLIDTPSRVVRSWKEIYAGYKENPSLILSRTFENPGYDQMVILKNIKFYSMCEHHMLPFMGVAHVAYIPGDRVVGLSKLARVVDCFARRLQLQERLTSQVAEAIEECLKPVGVGVIVQAEHFCMRMRGVEKEDSTMVTSALKGVFMESSVRAEFMSLVGGK